MLRFEKNKSKPNQAVTLNELQALTCVKHLPGAMRWGTLGGTSVSGLQPRWPCTWMWSSARKDGPVRSRTPPLDLTPCPAGTLSGREGPVCYLSVVWQGLRGRAKDGFIHLRENHKKIIKMYCDWENSEHLHNALFQFMYISSNLNPHAKTGIFFCMYSQERKCVHNSSQLRKPVTIKGVFTRNISNLLKYLWFFETLNAWWLALTANTIHKQTAAHLRPRFCSIYSQNKTLVIWIGWLWCQNFEEMKYFTVWIIFFFKSNYTQKTDSLLTNKKQIKEIKRKK